MSGATSRATSGAIRSWVMGAVLAIVAVGAAVWFVASGESGDSDAAGNGGTIEAPAGIPGEACTSLHEGHAAMAWNPTSADEMLEADCGWPYEPYLVATDGGREDPAIDVAFEPRRYQDLSDAISATGLGFCSVNLLPDEPGDGFVFGFRYEAAEPGCPDFTTTVELTAREYVTRAHRDGAANDLADAEAIVLGRWVLEVTGTDQVRIDELVESFIDMGARPMGDL